MKMKPLMLVTLLAICVVLFLALKDWMEPLMLLTLVGIGMVLFLALLVAVSEEMDTIGVEDKIKRVIQKILD